MQLPTSLTLSGAREVCAQLARAVADVAPGQGLELDASALQELDSSALAVLIEAQRLAGQRGLVLRLRQAPPKLMQLAALYGVEGLIGVDASASA